MEVSNSIWIPWMKRALRLASLAEGNTSPNPLVGAVVLDKDGFLVGEGFHSSAGRSHAEVQALNQAGESANDGTLVVSLEPCCHHGKTPPCTDAVLRSGVKRVVVALKDPDKRVAGQGLSILRSSGLEVITGVLEDEAAFQNRAFIFRSLNGRPWGTLKWAMSFDGRTALPNGVSKWISCPKSRNWVYKLRSNCDAVIIGGQTVRADNPFLTTRGISDREPLRVVISRRLEFPLEANLWDTSSAETLIAYGPECNENCVSELPKAPEKLELLESTPIALLEALGNKGCNRVLWECGPGLASQAINQGCVQDLMIFIAPRLLGGLPANTPLGDLGFSSIDQTINLNASSLEKLDQDWLFKFLV